MFRGSFHPQHCVSMNCSSSLTLCLYVHSIPNVMSLGRFHPQHYVWGIFHPNIMSLCIFHLQHYVSRYISSPAQTLLPPVLASLRPYYRDPYGRDRTGGQVQLMIDYQRHVPTPAAQASCKGSTKSPRLQQLRETMDEAAARRWPPCYLTDVMSPAHLTATWTHFLYYWPTCPAHLTATWILCLPHWPELLTLLLTWTLFLPHWPYLPTLLLTWTLFLPRHRDLPSLPYFNLKSACLFEASYSSFLISTWTLPVSLKGYTLPSLLQPDLSAWITEMTYRANLLSAWPSFVHHRCDRSTYLMATCTFCLL